jgi:hypothetical protein
LNAPTLQYPLPNLNTIVVDTKISSDINKNEQHGANTVNMNKWYEIVHHIHIGNQILHDAFEREHIHAVDEHEEYMDGDILNHGTKPNHLIHAT